MRDFSLNFILEPNLLYQNTRLASYILAKGPFSCFNWFRFCSTPTLKSQLQYRYNIGLKCRSVSRIPIQMTWLVLLFYFIYFIDSFFIDLFWLFFSNYGRRPCHP